MQHVAKSAPGHELSSTSQRDIIRTNSEMTGERPRWDKSKEGGL